MNLDTIILNLFKSPLTAAPVWLIAFIGLYYALNFLDKERQKKRDKNFIIENIEMIVMPYVQDAIIVAYKMSERSVDDLQKRMSGIDKLKFATIVYDMIPEVIMGIPRDLVYELIPRERFAELVSLAIDEVNEFIDDKQVKFDEEYQNWLESRRQFSDEK